MLNSFASISILIVVAVTALTIAWRAIKQGKVGPQFGLTLSKPKGTSCDDINPTALKLHPREADMQAPDTNLPAHLQMMQSTPKLNATLIDTLELDYGMVTLVVVDAQPPFLAPCKQPQLIPSIIEQVKLGISRGWGIVLLEVKPWAYEETTDPIMELLRNKYDRFTACQKEGDDGSLPVLDTCRRLHYPNHFFRVTGVLINACVSATAWGLVENNQACRVRVIKEACATSGDSANAWSTFKEGPRLVVSSQSIDKQIGI